MGLCPQYSHIGQGCTEVFVDVGFEHRVEMLELDVSNQRDDKDLPEEQKGGDGQSCTAAAELRLSVHSLCLARSQVVLGRSFSSRSATDNG